MTTPTDSSSPARAHEGRQRTRDEVDAIVSWVALEMVEGRWKRGRSLRELAEAKGVPVSTAKYWTRLASERAWSGDDDEVQEAKAAHLGQLEAIADEARGAGEFGEATRAIRTQHEILGTIRAGASVNVHLDARGQLRPEVQAAVEERVAKLTDAFSRAAARLGHTPDEWRAALAAELDAPALPETT